MVLTDDGGSDRHGAPRRRRGQHRTRGRGALTRLAWAGQAVLALAALAAFVSVYPLGQWPVLIGLGAFAGLIAWRRDAWLLALPGLLPVVDLAPLTGMIYWTESDALILCVLAVAGLREAASGGSGHRPDGPWRFGLPQLGLLLLMAASYALSTRWAVLTAVAASPDLLAGYDSPLNGVRLTKGFVLALLLLPTLALSFRADTASATRRLTQGLLLGLTLVSLAALWERVTFPGLSDFASDYRTTALFWEMHVGGAQLDGWLALTLPFLFWAVLRESSRLALAGWLLVGGLVAYALFTTFSRGLYAGAGVGLIVLLLAMWRQGGQWPHQERWHLPPLPVLLGWGVLAAALALAVGDVFKTGGYRGMAALLGLAAGVYVAGPAAAAVSWLGLLPAAVVAALASVGTFAMTAQLAKGAYLAYGLSAVGVLLLGGLAARRPGGRGMAWLAQALLGWQAFNVVAVGVHWAGRVALMPALLGVAVCLAPLGLWRAVPAFRWQPAVRGALLLAVAAGVAAVLAVTFNTYYASSRIETIDTDLAGRKQHWARGLAMPGAGEEWLGIGTGRFAAQFFWRAADGAFPGSHHLGVEQGEAFLRLVAPKHPLGFGGLYRVTQRVDGDLTLPVTVGLRARAPERPATLHVEICRRHLLYVQGCVVREVAIPAGADWQRYSVRLDKGELGASAGFPPRLTALSIANASPGQVIEIGEIRALDAQARDLLVNGSFAAGVSRWFFSSDRYHLPWHAKNLWLHYWIEQGWLGLLAFGLLSTAALFRLGVGGAAAHPLAPPLLAGLAGFFVVALFDSLVDAPRLTWMLFLLLFVALGIRSPPSQVARR